MSRKWNNGIREWRKTARKAGLTLVEVMLAIVILGIGSGTLMLATAKCLGVVSKARHYSTAQRLIHQVEVENPLPRDPEEFKEMSDSGDFEEDGYSWEREVTMVDEEIRPGLFTVRTRISWSVRDKERFEEAITYRYVEPTEKPAK